MSKVKPTKSGENFFYFGVGKDFLTWTLNTQAIKNDKYGCTETKSMCVYLQK